ncbi:NAD-dependent epimerase/dehydratase family protein [Spirillospora sp. CA-255316]
MGSSVFITGASGLIGKETIRVFAEAGWDVRATDARELPAGSMGLKASVEALDIRSITPETLLGSDVVVHLAALTMSAEEGRFGVTNTVPDAGQMLDVNVHGTNGVFRSSVAARVQGVVYASTAAVYGSPTFHPHLNDRVIGSDGPFHPNSLYAHTKLLNEGLAAFYADDSETHFIGLRPTFAYGLGRLDGISGRFADWILKAVTGQQAHLGHPFALDLTMQPIYVTDMARSVLAAAEASLESARFGAERARVFNSPTRERLSLGEMVNILRLESGNDDVAVTESTGLRAFQGPEMKVDDAFEFLRFKQEFDFRSSIVDMREAAQAWGLS